jgi:hypothetical protein
METDLRKCPDCAGAMEPQSVVLTSRHASRWWRCANDQCRAEWLLPMFETEMARSNLSTFSGIGSDASDAQLFWSRKKVPAKPKTELSEGN